MTLDMTLKIDGVDGESKIKDHEGEIDVLAWNWGLSQSGLVHVGGGGGSGKANIQDLSITKYIQTKPPQVLYANAATEVTSRMPF